MTHLRQDEIWDADAAARYDTPGTGMFAPEVLGPTVDRLAELAGEGRALELAVGTGRVAVPLAERGVPVTGIELSAPMVARLREKADEATIPVVMGDMATARAPGQFRLVYLVFNTISNLLTQDEQVACFRNAARHLEPGGRFVVELWVPDLRRLPPDRGATVEVSEPGYLLVDTYDVLTQHVVSHHVRFDETKQARLTRSPHRYVWPAELDLMARLAGFELESRHADWSGRRSRPPRTRTSRCTAWRRHERRDRPGGRCWRACRRTSTRARYVFVLADGTAGVEDAVVTVAEPEGLTLVLPRERADELGLPYDFVASWITLRSTRLGRRRSDRGVLGRADPRGHQRQRGGGLLPRPPVRARGPARGRAAGVAAPGPARPAGSELAVHDVGEDHRRCRRPRCR